MHLLGGINPVYAVSGLLVGGLVGLTGVGGGSLMTPLLILLFGIHPSTAVGTDLLYAAVTKTVGTGVHTANRNVDWLIVGRLAMGLVPPTTRPILALPHFGTTGPVAASIISHVLAISLIISSVILLLKNRIIGF